MAKILKSVVWDQYKVIADDGATYYTEEKADAIATLKAMTGEDVTKITRASDKQNENW